MLHGFKRAAQLGAFALIAFVGFNAGANPSKIPLIGQHFQPESPAVSSTSLSKPVPIGRSWASGSAGDGPASVSNGAVRRGNAETFSRGAVRRDLGEEGGGSALMEEGEGSAGVAPVREAGRWAVLAGDLEPDAGSSLLDSGAVAPGAVDPGGAVVKSGGKRRAAKRAHSFPPPAQKQPSHSVREEASIQPGGGDSAGTARIGGALAAPPQSLGLLTKLESQAGSLGGFKPGERRGASDARPGIGGRNSSGAPDTGAGKAHTETLYINVDAADLFVDPSTMESMPDGFTKEDLQTADVSYKMGGDEKTISLAKGSGLLKGEQVTWSGTESADGKWIQVSVGGQEAWVRKVEVSGPGWKTWKPGLEKAFEIREIKPGAGLTQIVAEAKSHVGERYVWGGNTPGSFDCSGLVQYSYRRFGLKIPRVSRDQKAAAKMIDRDQMQPGDLVFTGNPVKHVMMYTGKEMLVEAKGRKYGVVNSGLGQRTRGGKTVYYGTFRHLQEKKSD